MNAFNETLVQPSDIENADTLLFEDCKHNILKNLGKNIRGESFLGQNGTSNSSTKFLAMKWFLENELWAVYV